MNYNRARYKEGFTLIELLVVIAIIGILALISIVTLSEAYRSSYMAKALVEVRQIETALMKYQIDNGEYPADADRGVCPTGLEDMIDSGIWQEGSWPGSFYDWDHWESPSHHPVEEIYQISIRFCEVGGVNCRYPKEDWASGFDQHSAVFWCIKGPCRSHRNHPLNHPGYCLNCENGFPPYGF